MAKASTTQRGYGTAHQRERERWRPLVEAGEVNCARCGEPIAPDAEWDLGHADGDRTKYNGPEHSRQCNRSAGGRNGARVTNAKKASTFRDW
jgi:hypothetical protein